MGAHRKESLLGGVPAVVRHADRLSLEEGREQEDTELHVPRVPRRRDVRVEADDHAVSGLGLRLR